MDAVSSAYRDDELVYVDPETRTVVGVVEWGKTGEPKPKMRPNMDKEEEEEVPKDAPAAKGAKPAFKRRKKRDKFYPWGTYRAMRRVFKLEGKEKWNPPERSLDDVIEKALAQPFWD